MVRSVSWFAALLLGAGLLAPGMLHAQSRSAPTIQDEAGLFSKDARARANSDIAQIKSKHNKDLFIETLKDGPKTGQGAWARNRAKNFKVNGIYLVFTTEPKHFEVAVGNKTREKLFTSANIEHLVGILKTHMGKDRDEALQKSVAYVLDAMNANARTGGAQNAAANGPDEDGFFSDAPANPAAHRNTMSPWVSYALIIGAVLLVGWILMAVFRGIGSMAGGGGAGGGFMTGMLGGLFGAMAGMWIYNSFFGGSHAHAADPSSGADTDFGSTGGDYGNDGGDDFGDKGGGGGDWGGDGGGDWGGGGGDWGGGGDFGGGGGDW